MFSSYIVLHCMTRKFKKILTLFELKVKQAVRGRITFHLLKRGVLVTWVVVCWSSVINMEIPAFPCETWRLHAECWALQIMLCTAVNCRLFPVNQTGNILFWCFNASDVWLRKKKWSVSVQLLIHLWLIACEYTFEPAISNQRQKLSDCFRVS